MWQKTQDYLLVTIITFLVWLYAEGENVKNHELTVDLRFVPPTGRELLISPNRPQDPVVVTFKCSTTQYAQLQEALRDGDMLVNGAIPIEMTPNPSPEDIRQEVNLRERVQALPRVLELGIGVVDVRPARLTISVERFETRTLPVTVTTVGDTQLVDVAVEPAEAEVRLPASLAPTMAEGSRIEARLDTATLANVEMNVARTVSNVQLVPPLRGADVTVRPSTARVTFTIRKLAKDTVLPSVVVRLVVPLSAQNQYDVAPASEEDALLRGVKITGPNDLIDKIVAKEIKVWADVRLEIDDLGKGVERDIVSVVPHVALPAGVNLVEPPAPIKVKINKVP